MKDKIDNNSRSLKWEQNGELAHKDLSELIERLKKRFLLLGLKELYQKKEF